jgi:multiple antibiotic resistance protein
MTLGWFTEVLFGFTGLVSIVNPFAIAFVFLERTGSLTDFERSVLAKKIAIYAFVVLCVAFFLGTPILHFFGISMQALRIGGGLAVAVSGWTMLNAPDAHARSSTVKDVDSDNARAKAFFPFTVPLTTGPGAIATAIALNAGRSHRFSEWMLSAASSLIISALVALAIYFSYSRAGVVAQYLGAEGTKVAVRVSAFLLLCIGVQIILIGVADFITPLIALHGNVEPS